MPDGLLRGRSASTVIPCAGAAVEPELGRWQLRSALLRAGLCRHTGTPVPAELASEPAKLVHHVLHLSLQSGYSTANDCCFTLARWRLLRVWTACVGEL